jgi:hypothetical protein
MRAVDEIVERKGVEIERLRPQGGGARRNRARAVKIDDGVHEVPPKALIILVFYRDVNLRW